MNGSSELRRCRHETCCSANPKTNLKRILFVCNCTVTKVEARVHAGLWCASCVLHPLDAIHPCLEGEGVFTTKPVHPTLPISYRLSYIPHLLTAGPSTAFSFKGGLKGDWRVPTAVLWTHFWFDLTFQPNFHWTSIEVPSIFCGTTIESPWKFHCNPSKC